MFCLAKHFFEYKSSDHYRQESILRESIEVCENFERVLNQYDALIEIYFNNDWMVSDEGKKVLLNQCLHSISFLLDVAHHIFPRWLVHGGFKRIIDAIKFLESDLIKFDLLSTAIELVKKYVKDVGYASRVMNRFSMEGAAYSDYKSFQVMIPHYIAEKEPVWREYYHKLTNDNDIVMRYLFECDAHYLVKQKIDAELVELKNNLLGIISDFEEVLNVGSRVDTDFRALLAPEEVEFYTEGLKQAKVMQSQIYPSEVDLDELKDDGLSSQDQQETTRLLSRSRGISMFNEAKREEGAEEMSNVFEGLEYVGIHIDESACVIS